MKKFVVAVSGLTEAEETSFIEFIRGKGLAWWHRIPNVWLLTDATGRTSGYEIRQFLMPLANARIGMVIENPDFESWSGFAPKSIKEETFDWVHENIKRYDS